MTDIKTEIIGTLLETIDDTHVWSQSEPKFFGPSTRTLSFFTDIDSTSALLLISQINHLALTDPEEPITIHMNTEGGSFTDALSIYDAIRNTPPPVICVATGLCASGGLLILAAADYKLATENTIFYYHEPVFSQSSSINSTKDMESLNGFYKFCQSTAGAILKEAMDISERTWKKNFDSQSTGFYFDTNKALKFKLIDKIAESNKVDFEFTEEGD